MSNKRKPRLQSIKKRHDAVAMGGNVPIATEPCGCVFFADKKGLKEIAACPPHKIKMDREILEERAAASGIEIATGPRLVVP